MVLSDSVSPLWLHSDLCPTSAWPSEDTLHFGEALSVTSSITTPAARQQVHPLSLAAAALFSLCLFLYTDMPLSFSCSSLLLFLWTHPRSSLWVWLVYGCQTWQITHRSYMLLLNRLISLMASSFITALYSLVQPHHLPTTPSTLSSLEVSMFERFCWRCINIDNKDNFLSPLTKLYNSCFYFTQYRWCCHWRTLYIIYTARQLHDHKTDLMKGLNAAVQELWLWTSLSILNKHIFMLYNDILDNNVLPALFNRLCWPFPVSTSQCPCAQSQNKTTKWFSQFGVKLYCQTRTSICCQNSCSLKNPYMATTVW